VTTVTVTCTTNTYTVGGTLSGLAATESVVLQDNAANNLTVSANGAFTFTTPISSGSPYAVTVLTNPASPSQNCVVTLGGGMVTSANITSVVVTCTTDTCPAETTGNCVLTTTNSGSTDTGTCAAGYAGSCSFSCSLGAWTQIADTCVSILYFPSGPQVSIAASTLTGWNLCYQDLYDVSMQAVISTVQANCSKGHTLLACGVAGSPTYDLVAAGTSAAVFTDTGAANNNQTTVNNGVGWYFDPNWSWGFVLAGDTPNKDECDVTTSPDDTLRLCWHELPAVGGYRCGANTGLNSSTAYARYVYTAP
jgi:hypothetical protein